MCMHEILKQKLAHNLANFIIEDNLITLAQGLSAGIKILEQNDALELLELPNGSYFYDSKRNTN